LNEVVLPNETVVDIALDDPTNFSTLVAAVVKAELLPALTNPFANLTVFAPTNAAFSNLATALSTDLNGILALPNLQDVLLYHVLGTEKLSTQLSDGNILALNGKNLAVSVSPTVKINDANIITVDVQSENGVVHVIKKVLVPSNNTNIASINTKQLSLYPNPSSSLINVDGLNNVNYEIINMYGIAVLSGDIINGSISIDSLSQGRYIH
jgi:transforming growth factor-beta-induced protein